MAYRESEPQERFHGRVPQPMGPAARLARILGLVIVIGLALVGWMTRGCAPSSETAVVKTTKTSDTDPVNEDIPISRKLYQAQAVPEPQPDPAPTLKASGPDQTTLALQGLQAQMAEIANHVAKQNERLQALEQAKPAAPTRTRPNPEELRRQREEAEKKAKAWKPLTIDHTKTVEQTASLSPKTSPHMLAPGTYIPIIVETGISSDAPGAIKLRVRQSVRDPATGEPLIPQGTVLMGESTGTALFGDNRLKPAFDSMTFPNGEVYTVKAMAGSDQTGRGGFTDQINRHYGRILLSIGLTSVLRMGSGIGMGYGQGALDRLGTTAASEVANQGTQQVRQTINTSPTIEIRPGYRGVLIIREPLIFPHPYRE